MICDRYNYQELGKAIEFAFGSALHRQILLTGLHTAVIVPPLFEKGYIFFERISWDNFNESVDLKSQIEAYKEFTGYYPESVHVDKIYRTRENRAWCKERGIRMSGLPLGRPPLNVSKEAQKQATEDERIRNAIEGKFGTCANGDLVSVESWLNCRIRLKLP